MNKKLRNTNKTPILINISGTTGKTMTAKIIESVLTKIGYKVGLASSIGIYLNGRRIQKHDRTGPKSFEFLHTRSKKLDVVICENVLRHIKIDNFYPAPTDTCLITNVSDDHVHQTKTGEIKEVAEIKSKLIDQCKSSAIVILNGDNRYTRNIATKKRVNNLILFTTQKSNAHKLKSLKPKLIYHLEEKSIYKIRQNKKRKCLIQDLSKIPLTLDMKLEFNLYNILAAICVLDNLRGITITPKELEVKLSEIKLDYSNIPGRFNIHKFRNFTVILDDAHNPLSYKEAFKTAKRLPHKRLVSVLKASSTRTPKFIIQLGKIAGKNSDFVYIKESFAKDSKRRKSFRGKIAQLIKKGILQTNFSPSKIEIVLEEETAVETAIRNAKENDLILIFGYRIDKLSKLISNLKKSSPL